jgi:hypothetical protein
VRAPARNPRWLNPAPCTSAKGRYLVGARKQVERTVDGDEHAESDGRPKNPSTNTGLSDVGISYDQSSRWQKRAAVSEEIFEQVQDKTLPNTAGMARG